MKIELEDIEGNTYSETIPKYPSAEIANKCEATFNAHVSATGSQTEGSVDNAFEAIAEQKRIIVNWLNERYFEQDLGPDNLSPPSQDKIMMEYSDYIEGVAVEQKKRKEDQTTKESETESEPISDTRQEDTTQK